MEKLETLPKGSLPGLFRALREQPLLFIISAALLFAIMAASTTAFTGTSKPTGSIEAQFHAEPISINRSAQTPAELISRRSFDAAELEAFLLERLRPSGQEEKAALKFAFEPHDEDGLLITLSSVQNPETLTPSINEHLNAFADELNLERAKQRDLAYAWMRRFNSIRHLRLEEAKSAISLSPFEVGDLTAEDPLETERLLRLMIDATVKARADLQGRSNDSEIATTQIAVLTSDMTRLTSVMTDLEVRHAAQVEQVNALKDAEEGLARHLEEGKVLDSPDSVLNRPAAKVLSPATVVNSDGHLWSMATLWMMLLALSLLGGAAGTILFSHLRSKVTADEEPDLLNNPHWPLPQGAHRDL